MSELRILRHKKTITVRDLQGMEHVIELRMSRPVRFRFWLAAKLVGVVGWLIGADVDEQAAP